VALTVVSKFLGGDQEFSFRLAAGFQNGIWPTAKVYHLKHASSLSEYFRKKFNIGYWKVVVLRRYPGKFVTDSHTPPILKIQILLTGTGMGLLLLGCAQPLALWLSLIAWATFFLTTAPFLVTTMVKDQQAALVSPILLLVRSMALGFGFMTGVIGTIGNRLKNNP
jgi:hypothetical protein